MANVKGVKKGLEAGRQSLSEVGAFRPQTDSLGGDMNRIRRRGREISEQLGASAEQAYERIQQIGEKAVQAAAKGEEAGGHFALALEGTAQPKAEDLFRYVGGLVEGADRYPGIVQHSQEGLDKVRAGLAMVLEGVIGITEAAKEAADAASEIDSNNFMADRTAQDIIEGL